VKFNLLTAFVFFFLFTYSCKENTTKSSEKDILNFSINNIAGTIDSNNISLEVPYETDINNLIAVFETNGQKVFVNEILQVSGHTVNDFSNPLAYKVIAEDESIRIYVVNIKKALANSNQITSFYIDGQMEATIINHNEGSIKLTMPSFIDISDIAATFVSNGKFVKISETPQISGISKNDFTQQLIYTVVAVSGDEKHYIVEVGINNSSEKAITAFSIANQVGPTNINEDEATIRVMIPNQFKTNLLSLIPTFTFTGYRVYIDNIQQLSGISANNFTEEIPYTVKAPNGDIKTYLVAVWVIPEILSFKINGYEGLINDSIISVSLPNGTNLSNLTPLISLSSLTAIVNPASGIVQNFTTPVIYSVNEPEAANKDYTVSVGFSLYVTKRIISFTIPNQVSSSEIDEASGTINLIMPYGTDKNALVPTIVFEGMTLNPASGAVQNFSSTMTYTVTAEDSTTKDYEVTITNALNPVKKITSFEFPFQIGDSVINESLGTISITMPYGFNKSNLIPTIVFEGMTLNPASGVAQNFSSTMTYTVTAEDSTTKDYQITVFNRSFLYYGDAVYGGLVAHFFSDDDPGYIPGESHGLILALVDQSTGAPWITGGDTQTTLNAGTSQLVGYGQANTNAMINQTGFTGGAAKICDDYINVDIGTGIYDDWFLPSKLELIYMSYSPVIQYILDTSKKYWSSTEYNANNAYGLFFPYLAETKSSNNYVRCVRNF